MDASVVIYCDFDGTVTQDDVIDVLLTDLADPDWRRIEADWERGLIGSRECLARQIPLIRGGWPAIARRLDTIRLDPTFAPFASWCAANGWPLRLVSDGLDRVITTLLERDGIVVASVRANHLAASATDELAITFPYPPVQPDCRAGLCKCLALRQAAPGVRRVVIGDGHSDWCWAARADQVFAKSTLLTHCLVEGIACTPFRDFDEVRRVLSTGRRVRPRRPQLVSGP